MPEGPVLMAWAHKMARTVERRPDKGRTRVTARCVWYPRCFALGTKKKPYTSCNAFRAPDYDHAADLSPSEHEDAAPHLRPSSVDISRSKGKSYQHLLGLHNMGELHVAVSGKIMAIAAGKHLIFVNFGLEASVVKVTADQYAQMAHPSRDVPGPNKNKEAAARMRSFSVPNTFKDPNSPKPTADRHLNIMMALQCNNGDVWLFIDHTRLMRFEVHSRGTDWTAKDLFLDSDVWSLAFGGKYGPSFFQETTRPQVVLDRWRKKMQAEHQKRKNGLRIPITDAMCYDMETFNGFGKHTSADAVFCMGFLTYMPVGVIVCSDELWATFCAGILTYVLQFRDDRFFVLVASETNTINPLAFDYPSNYHYLQKFLSVFRCHFVVMTAAHWNAFNRLGLFSPTHVIGSPVAPSDMGPECTSPTVLVPCFAHYRPNHKSTKAKSNSVNGLAGPIKKSYSPIVARPPVSWNIPPWEIKTVKRDITDEGQKTTIGVAQFAMFNANMTHLHLEAEETTTTTVEPMKRKTGRRAKIRTGQRGRCPKEPRETEQLHLTKRSQKFEYDPVLLSEIRACHEARAQIASADYPDNFNIARFLVGKSDSSCATVTPVANSDDEEEDDDNDSDSDTMEVDEESLNVANDVSGKNVGSNDDEQGCVIQLATLSLNVAPPPANTDRSILRKTCSARYIQQSSLITRQPRPPSNTAPKEDWFKRAIRLRAEQEARPKQPEPLKPCPAVAIQRSKQFVRSLYALHEAANRRRLEGLERGEDVGQRGWPWTRR